MSDDEWGDIFITNDAKVRYRQAGGWYIHWWSRDEPWITLQYAKREFWR